MAHHAVSPTDLVFLQMLTATEVGESRPSKMAKMESPIKARRPAMDPLILQTAAASGPHVTRNHYMHDCYPHAQKYARCDEEPEPQNPPRPVYKSQQAPRRIRLQGERTKEAALKPPSSSRTGSMRRRSSANATTEMVRNLRSASSSAPGTPAKKEGPIKVVCHARTRVPTPHGDVLLHLFKNDKDDKEHLAFVFDRPQLAETGDADLYIRSRSLDAVWRAGETENERIVRGAYVGRLGPQHAVASTSAVPIPATQAEPPVVRIHSECFTGETMGSQRCDCGEQLDEAFRLAATSRTGRGIVVYLRQEGRGIGLLEKIKSYNIQDLGHDTFSANLMLGHGADMRSYAVAAAILGDLGIDEVKLLTNNPDKIEQVTKEGIKVSERLPMVPRVWRARLPRSRSPSETEESGDDIEEREAMLRRAGIGMIGAGDTESAELEKYLATKVAKMGHLLERPVLSQQNSREHLKVRRKPKTSAASYSPGLDDALASSVASLQTDLSLECDEDCECRNG